MNIALLTSCRKIGQTFAQLGGHLGKEGPRHDFWKKCASSTNPIDLAAEVRGKIMGSSLVVVGIGSEDPVNTMRTLVTASRSHQCVVLMTFEGYHVFIDFWKEMTPTERSIFESRIVGLVLVGDREECFISVAEFAPRADIRHIGGLQWAPTTCDEIAAFIRKTMPKAA